ncbi:MAG: thiamine diphosphokinase [Lachnospiraceae bacterium]|nr:thiamine diphosphokinase [Lachnospiraceae bacterium]
MYSKTCFIVAAGLTDVSDFPLPIKPGDLLIAADAGYKTLLDHSVKPDLVIGDFDSSDEPEGDFEVIRLPVEKDDTDTVYSVKEGFKRGFDRFLIYGALSGDRLSHTAANIQLLSMIDEMGGSAKMIFGGTTVFTVSGSKSEMIRGNAGDHISLFSLSETALVSASDLYYPVTQLTIKRSFPLGVSNHLTGEEAHIQVHKGEVLVITETVTTSAP